MSKCLENYYDIDKLYIVKLDDQAVNGFNPNIYFVVEKLELLLKNEKYYESYTECITDHDLSERVLDTKTSSVPSIFKDIKPFPKEFCTEDELYNNKIGTIRLYDFFQKINFVKKDDDIKYLRKIG